MPRHGSNRARWALPSVGQRMNCLDDATLDDFVEGRLKGAALEDADAHVDACVACSELVALVAGGMPSEVAPGDAIGRYTVIERLGRGAMGVVYLANDPTLDRRVALKLILPGASPSAEDQMVKEAQAMARLSHPNVAAVYEVGRAAHGVYLTMEFIAGMTLRQWLFVRKRSIEEIREVFLQAGHGLAAAHDAGLVHRDFKPENVMIGDDRRVRVTDFGLARSVDASDDSGRLIGTPAYMAFEQLVEGEATKASDQFAYAATLFEAIAGKRPFDGATPTELREAIERGPRLDALTHVPTRLRSAIARALDPTPSRRFDELRLLLREIEGRQPRSRVVMVMGAAIVALGIVVARVGFVHSTPPLDVCGAGATRVSASFGHERRQRLGEAFKEALGPNETTLAEAIETRSVAQMNAFTEQWQTAYRSTCEASNVRHEQSDSALDARMRCLDRRLDSFDALAASFEHADRSTVLGATAAVLDLPSIAECSHIESSIGAEPRPTDPALATRLASNEEKLAVLRATASTTDYASARSEAEAIVSDAVSMGYRPVIAEAEIVASTIARRAGASDAAAKLASDAQLAAEAARADGASARAWLEILAVSGSRGRPAEVEAKAPQADAAIQRIGAPPDLRAAYLLELGLAHTATGKLEAAEPELREALADCETSMGPRSLRVARVLTALGDVARQRGDLEGALALHQRALAIDSEVLGPAHPALARHHHNIAGVLRLLGRRDDALQSYSKARELELVLGARHPAVGLTENSMAIVMLEKGDTAGAEAHLVSALGILGDANDPERALVMMNLGLAEATKRSHEKAIEWFDRALVVLESSLGRDHLRVAGAKRSRSASHRALGHDRLAHDDLVDALRIVSLDPNPSTETKALRLQIEQELSNAKSVAPKTPTMGRVRPLGSLSYGSAPSWESD